VLHRLLWTRMYKKDSPICVGVARTKKKAQYFSFKKKWKSQYILLDCASLSNNLVMWSGAFTL
jgi:hypothetical protein